MKSELILHSLELPVRIGHTAEERKQTQAVEFDISCSFNEPPKACETDRLEDGVCYDEIAQLLENYVSSKEFHLIEHLCWECVQVLKNKVKSVKELKLSVKKLYPPLKQKNKGASFSLKWKAHE